MAHDVMIGLGRILTEERTARGVSLEQAERDTRIARRYLLALEEEQWDEFPARAQARGFLRLYAQYLELDPAEMLALFPHAGPVDESDGLIHADRIFRGAGVQPRSGGGVRLPQVDLRRPGYLAAALFAGALLLASLTSSQCATGQERANAGLAALSEQSRGAGLRVPDVREDILPAALEKLNAAGIRPLVLEVRSDRVAEGLIISQSPPPGAVVIDGAEVTLVVSSGRP
jgi:hypothetical protein